MNLLLDTNIFLEVLLGQVQEKEASRVLSNTGKYSLFMTDFSLHSIGVLLFRRHAINMYTEFLNDISIVAIQVVGLHQRDIALLAAPAERYHLDFDDAYQYETAKRFGLTLVSFDADFDKTDIGRKTPQEILAQL